MIYLQVEHLRSPIFDPNYRSNNGVSYDKGPGKFDFESWACQVSVYQDDFPHGRCRDARARRIADILCCIVAIATAVVRAWALRGTRATFQQAQINKRPRREAWLGDENVGIEVESGNLSL